MGCKCKLTDQQTEALAAIVLVAVVVTGVVFWLSSHPY